MTISAYADAVMGPPHRKGPPDSPPFTVAGFTAIIARNPNIDVSRTCQVFVGVAPDQTVEVAYTYRGHDPTIDRDAVCGRARAVAEMVLQNFLIQAGR